MSLGPSNSKHKLEDLLADAEAKLKGIKFFCIKEIQTARKLIKAKDIHSVLEDDSFYYGQISIMKLLLREHFDYFQN
jgi:hypothetical protein